MKPALKLLTLGLLCLNISGCEYIEDILHPDDGKDEAKIDKSFKSDALQLGLSESTVTRLCTATAKISVKCVSQLNSNTNQQEVRVEYNYNDVTLKNDYAKSTNASRVIFHLPADSATASIEFENNRTIQFNDGLTYTWTEPTDITSADLSNGAAESIAKLTATPVVTRVSETKLTYKSNASLNNVQYTLTAAQALINSASTVQFPVLTTSVSGNNLTAATDASFAMFTAGHTAILTNFSAAFSTAIEQSWF